MRNPTKITYTEYYDLDNGINSNVRNCIKYSRRPAPDFLETLEICLFDYSDSLDGRYRFTRRTEGGEPEIIRYFNTCSPGRGCKTDTERVSSIPQDITDFLEDFPDHIRNIAGIR